MAADAAAPTPANQGSASAAGAEFTDEDLQQDPLGNGDLLTPPEANRGEAVQVHLGRLQLCRGGEGTLGRSRRRPARAGAGRRAIGPRAAAPRAAVCAEPRRRPAAWAGRPKAAFWANHQAHPDGAGELLQNSEMNHPNQLHQTADLESRGTKCAKCWGGCPGHRIKCSMRAVTPATG